MASAGALSLGVVAWRTNLALRETRATLTTSHQTETSTQKKLTTIQEQLASCQSSSAFSANVTQYLSEKFDELDDILIATDNAAVDFIDWCSTNGTFYGDDYTEGNRRHAAWVAKQEQTNKDYAALTEEIAAFINKLEGVAAADDVGIQHAF